MMKHSRQTIDTSDLLAAPMERVLAALEDYLDEQARDVAAGPTAQGRAEAARDAIRVARGEWWQLGLELNALRQRVAQMEGEVARLERFVGKMATAMDQSEWTTGA
jgi:hypothetical protein